MPYTPCYRYDQAGKYETLSKPTVFVQGIKGKKLQSRGQRLTARIGADNHRPPVTQTTKITTFLTKE